MLPWSFEWQLKQFSLNFPAEVLIAALGLVSLAEYWSGKDRRSLLMFGLLGIVLGSIVVLTSTMPLVSFKRVVVDFAHFWVFAWLIARNWQHWPDLLRIFAISMAIFVLYTLCRHAGYHFREDQAMLTPMPFFSDHNSYAAVLVATFWAYGGLCKRKWFDVVVMGLFVLGIFFAGSRAAWLSFAFGLMLWGGKYLPYVLSIKRTTQLISGIVVLVFLVFATGLFQKKIQAYVVQDVSLAERINRYKCAWRMAQERPILGFGSGTFQFQYLAFQREADMTRISVREPAYERHVHMNGRGGGPHSEYFGTLAEHGWPGLLLKLVFMGWVFWGLTKEIKKTEHTENQHIPFSIFICLITIALHGFVNDLCHDARIVALIWGCLAYQFMSSSSFLRLRGASSS